MSQDTSGHEFTRWITKLLKRKLRTNIAMFEVVVLMYFIVAYSAANTDSILHWIVASKGYESLLVVSSC